MTKHDYDMSRVIVNVPGKEIELSEECVRKLEAIKRAIGGNYKTAIIFSIMLATALIESGKERY